MRLLVGEVAIDRALANMFCVIPGLLAIGAV